MADEPQDTTEEPEAAGDDTAASGDGPNVEQDADGVAEATEHSTKLSESEKPDPLSPGQPRGVDPGQLSDKDSAPPL